MFAYLRLIDGENPLKYLKMDEGWLRGVAFGFGLAAIVLSVWLVRIGSPQMTWSAVTWNSVLSTSFGIGFFEEIPFRGFILQKLASRMNFWLANLLCSLIFVAMHLPGWITLHLFAWPLALHVFALSFVLGAAFRFANSLWTCIVAHSANDFIAFILFQGR